MSLRFRVPPLDGVVTLDKTLDLVTGTAGCGMGEQQKMISGHFRCPFTKPTAIAPFDDLKMISFCGYLKRSFLTLCVRKSIICPGADFHH